MKKGAKLKPADDRIRLRRQGGGTQAEFGGLVTSRRADLRLGTVSAISDQGILEVAVDGCPPVAWACDWLQASHWPPMTVSQGDRVLIWVHGIEGRPVVVGRIGAYRAAPEIAQLTLEATESLTLKCGEASIDLRADGKVMVRGEDVLLRAKGTQRIRAGNVAIN